MATSGEWRMVHRRKRFPDNWRTPANEELDKVRPYVPYKQTYAQAVARPKPRPSSQGSTSQSPTYNHPSPPSNPASRSPSPPTPPGTRYYTSPHSPTSLRFPPMASFPEWRGRCFRCLRLGHTAAQCCNLFKCARCWMDGHIASHCTTSRSTNTTQPPQPAAQPPSQFEPSFDELLQEAHEVVKMAMETKLVREEEIRVAQLAREKHLIHLPRGLSVETFVKALPRWLWDQGFDIQQWSPLDGATVVMPRFKVLLDLEDFPLYLWRDKQLVQAVS
ncbi:hypothetical protein FCM35_KLT00732 [Carex littledalei]|uniref:CCHC-type domain-containing protein n=1 Tax=Carex littledalei TaxID=544730 RepID=A0A833S2D2_9POAL|nr:hypothetical protein FCM35_KLT00732 [Carex littledalei]